jgi:hypothetical protein
MNSFLRRIEAIERRRSTAAVPMISASEVADAKASLRRKLGLSPAKTEDGPAAPITRKSLAAAGGRALRKLRCFLELHEPTGEKQ